MVIHLTERYDGDKKSMLSDITDNLGGMNPLVDETKCDDAQTLDELAIILLQDVYFMIELQ